jgi:hypothetical protein
LLLCPAHPVAQRLASVVCFADVSFQKLASQKLTGSPTLDSLSPVAHAAADAALLRTDVTAPLATPPVPSPAPSPVASREPISLLALAPLPTPCRHASAESIAEVATNPKACSGANSCYILHPKSRAATGAQALSSRLNSPRPSPVTDACAEQAADARAVTIGPQTPTLMPSRQPSSVPSPMPTKRLIPRPNPAPTLLPSPAPTKLPSPLPTDQPTPVTRPTVSCPLPTPPRLLFQRYPCSAPVRMQQPTHSPSPVPSPWPAAHVNAYQPAHPTA